MTIPSQHHSDVVAPSICWSIIAIPSRIKRLTFRVAPVALKKRHRNNQFLSLVAGNTLPFSPFVWKIHQFDVVQTLTAVSPHRCLCPAPLVLLRLWVGPAEGAGAVVSASVVVTRVGKWNGGLERGDGLVAVQAVLGAAVSRVFNWGGRSKSSQCNPQFGLIGVCAKLRKVGKLRAPCWSVLYHKDKRRNYGWLSDWNIS